MRSLVSLRFERGIPRLVVHEKYERIVTWALRVLTALGILTSLVALSPLAALGVAVGLLLVEQFFERTVFEYTTIYVLPFPDFSFRSESWIEMAYALPADAAGLRDRSLSSVCALVFDDAEQASGVAKLIDSWATGPDGSGVDNVVLSFVLEPHGGYNVYVYPDLARRDLSDLFEETRRLQLEEKLSKRQQQLVMYFTLGRYFKSNPSSRFHDFRRRQEDLRSPYMLGCFLKRDGAYQNVEYERWVPMRRLRVVERSELSRTDVEWVDPRIIRRRNKQRGETS